MLYYQYLPSFTNRFKKERCKNFRQFNVQQTPKCQKPQYFCTAAFFPAPNQLLKAAIIESELYLLVAIFPPFLWLPLTCTNISSFFQTCFMTPSSRLFFTQFIALFSPESVSQSVLASSLLDLWYTYSRLISFFCCCKLTARSRPLSYMYAIETSIWQKLRPKKVGK